MRVPAQRLEVWVQLAESNHRVKNVLATVQSIAAQTLRGSGSLEEFGHAFEGRLEALSRTSTVLAVMAATWGVVMAVSPLLQIRKIIRRGSSRDVSIGYLAVLVIGFCLWIAYGISIANPALIVPNSVALSVGSEAPIPHKSPGCYGRVMREHAPFIGRQRIGFGGCSRANQAWAVPPRKGGRANRGSYGHHQALGKAGW
jgi:MtN3 and saliva related transmembrane protein